MLDFSKYEKGFYKVNNDGDQERLVMLPCPCGSEAVKCGDWGMWGVRCSNYYECDNIGVIHQKQSAAIALWNEKVKHTTSHLQKLTQNKEQ